MPSARPRPPDPGRRGAFMLSDTGTTPGDTAMQSTALPAPAPRGPLTWLIVPLAALGALVFWLLAPAFDHRVPGDPADPAGNPAHFWLIAAAGLLSLLVGLLMSEAGRRRSDARVLLLSLGMMSA